MFTRKGEGLGFRFQVTSDRGLVRTKSAGLWKILPRHCERSEAIQSRRAVVPVTLDCRVAALLAMTKANKAV